MEIWWNMESIYTASFNRTDFFYDFFGGETSRYRSCFILFLTATSQNKLRFQWTAGERGILEAFEKDPIIFRSMSHKEVLWSLYQVALWGWYLWFERRGISIFVFVSSLCIVITTISFIAWCTLFYISHVDHAYHIMYTMFVISRVINYVYHECEQITSCASSTICIHPTYGLL